MSFIADRMRSIKPSPTLEVGKVAAELKKQGKDIISLGAGEPDFDTPPNIKERAREYIKSNRSGKYTNVDGMPELKSAVQSKFQRENNLHYNLNEIIVSSGAKQVLFNLFLASINPGDEVIIPTPYWVSYPDMVTLAGGVPVFIPCKIENELKLTAKQLKSAINKNTKWLILNSPNNPTGAVYSRAELKELAEILHENKHVYIVEDSIYEHITFDGVEFCSLAETEPSLKNRIFTVNGVSKAYSMTGWRIGYGAGNADLIKAMSEIQSHSTSNPTAVSQVAAIEAINGPQSYIQEHKAQFQQKRDLALSILSDIPGMVCTKPQGAFYLFPSCTSFLNIKVTDTGIIKNSSDFVIYLLNTVGVSVVPGSAFGLEGHFRLSYATSFEDLKDGCERIKRACEKLKVNF